MEFSSQMIKLEELEKRLNSLNKKISTETNKLENITSSLETVNNSIEGVSLSVGNLSSSLNELSSEVDNIQSGGGSDIYNVFDSIKLKSKRWGIGSVRPDRIFFVCKPYVLTKIKVKAEIFYKTTAAYNAYFRMLLNSTTLTDGIVYEEKFDGLNGTLEKTVEFEYEFYPTQENNMLMFVAHAGTTIYTQGTSGFTNLEVTVFGINVSILTRRMDFRSVITKDFYYLTRNTETSCEYLRAPRNNVSLTTPFVTIGNIKPTEIPVYADRIHPFNFTFVPSATYNSETNKFDIDLTINRFYCSFSVNSYIYYVYENPPANAYSLSVPSQTGFGYTVGHPAYKTSLNYNLGITTTNGPCNIYTVVSLPKLYVEQRIKLNEDFVPGLWVDNCAVFAKDWEDHPGERPHCYVATDVFGDVYFFPNHNATYKIYIGKGHQVNAYMQSDLSINIYMRWLNNIHKKILIYNSATGIYELQEGEELIKNALEYLEGYGNDYFINRLGTWEYVNP